MTHILPSSSDRARELIFCGPAEPGVRLRAHMWLKEWRSSKPICGGCIGPCGVSLQVTFPSPHPSFRFAIVLTLPFPSCISMFTGDKYSNKPHPHNELRLHKSHQNEARCGIRLGAFFFVMYRKWAQYRWTTTIIQLLIKSDYVPNGQTRGFSASGLCDYIRL